MAWAGSVQRANLFVGDAKDRKILQAKIRHYVTKRLLPRYEERCSEERHYKNLASLVKLGTAAVPSILRCGSYRYGVAQKLLNLSLKYHWCLGRITEPPHCPVDRLIINRTDLRDKVNWTEIREEEQYRIVIAAIKRVAKGQSLARDGN